ncbi:hypothetical protein KUTeg_009089 [Tegillarca granosa]|uniref:Uncharacterized protein n=1 Tax=Tegillarca granosa TaxID=220873 RepID=A0ABQ9FC88_TEGGR|nr:hypothetical protein KUTeg_009089 [Tegillarca granosa]
MINKDCTFVVTRADHFTHENLFLPVFSYFYNLDHDYQPIDIERNTQIRVPPPVSQLHDKEVKFDGRTKYNEFFKHPGTTTRVRYGDFHENRPYIPPQVKFEGSSITQSSFVPKKLEEPTRDFKPEHHLISTEGKQEFNTSYKESYTKPLVKPCKAYIYLLQQELKRQREARAQNQNQAISIKILEFTDFKRENNDQNLRHFTIRFYLNLTLTSRHTSTMAIQMVNIPI